MLIKKWWLGILLIVFLILSCSTTYKKEDWDKVQNRNFVLTSIDINHYQNTTGYLTSSRKTAQFPYDREVLFFEKDKALHEKIFTNFPLETLKKAISERYNINVDVTEIKSLLKNSSDSIKTSSDSAAHYRVELAKSIDQKNRVEVHIGYDLGLGCLPNKDEEPFTINFYYNISMIVDGEVVDLLILTYAPFGCKYENARKEDDNWTRIFNALMPDEFKTRTSGFYFRKATTWRYCVPIFGSCPYVVRDEFIQQDRNRINTFILNSGTVFFDKWLSTIEPLK